MTRTPRVGDRIAQAAIRLQPVSDTPRLDAELLMAETLGRGREAMLLSHLRDTAPPGFEAKVARRLAHEPVAYIIGRRDFWTIDVEVGPGVLIPRPDSETLLEAALDHFGPTGPKRILDLGTGPGSLLLAALDQWPEARGLGVDASPIALDFARRNARRLGLADRASFVLGDWAEGVGDRFDLILCNPPYVEEGADLSPQVIDWEPAQALFAGPDGLAEYRRIAPMIGARLEPGGIGCVEIGAGQRDRVAPLFEKAGLAVNERRDLAGVERCLVLRIEQD